MEARPEAVAGMFYPADARVLRETVRSLLQQAGPPANPTKWPKAVIVPHAGYVYSGATAARAFAELAPGRGTIRRIVLLGPVHRVPVMGLALPGSPAFRTPLGTIPIDEEGMHSCTRLTQVLISPRAHAMEHSLEVQLPFLQEVLGDFTLLPLAVGDATPRQVAEVLEQVWGGPETVIVISSDLSHYLPYQSAQAVDRETVDTVLKGSATLDHDRACGATPVNGLLLAAPRHGLAARLLQLCNSGDTAGDKSRVVGYASIAFDEAKQPADDVPEDAGATLLPIARSAIAAALGHRQEASETAAWLHALRASFVTLRHRGELRGCVGSIEPMRPLVADVKRNAVAAALHDARFPCLQASELAQVRIEVSLLTKPLPMVVRDEDDAVASLRPSRDGLILHWGSRRATFLQQVWDEVPDPRDFLLRLKRKAGLPADFWDDSIRLERYSVRKWGEA